MNLPASLYSLALHNVASRLGKIYSQGRLRGLEATIQEGLCRELDRAGISLEQQVSLHDLGGKNLWEYSGVPRVDIVVGETEKHAIELKVIELPNFAHAAPLQRLWHIGQLSSDYWRIKKATSIGTGELGVLALGSMVAAARTPDRTLRQFHDAMYLDYTVSLLYGELKNELRPSSPMYAQRRDQQKAIREMGLDIPFVEKQAKWMVAAFREFAYIKIPIVKQGVRRK